MAKVTGGLLSLSASGKIADAIVFGSWKGIKTARQYVRPANPQTTAQTAVRTPFSWLNRVFKTMPSGAQAQWASAADGRALTQRNVFISTNLPGLIGVSDLAAFSFSPGSKGGLAVSNPVFTPGDDQVTITAAAPTLPAGWTVTAMHAAVIRQQDPDNGVLYDVFYGTDASDPYSINIASLANAQTYVCGVWGEYLRADGVTAYGPASMGTALTT